LFGSVYIVEKDETGRVLLIITWSVRYWQITK